MGKDIELAPSPGRRVFISYARDDRPRVEPLIAGLESHGCSVWIDSRLTGGAVFTAEIEAALRAADAVVVVWTEKSIASDWVRDEASLARDLGRLVPVRLDPVKPPLGFGQYHTVDLSQWHGGGDAPEIAQVLQAIAQAGHGPTAMLAALAGNSRLTPSRRLLMLAGAGLAVPLAGGAWWFTRGGGAQGGPPEHSVAVLPFVNLSGDPGQDYFAAGLSEEIRGALARIESLQVAARTSSGLFANSHDDSALIGRKLGVAWLLEGSVRRNGGVVRVSAQLAKAATGYERWSQTFDRPMTDVFAIQSEIAQLVAGAMQVKVMGAPVAAATGGTSNPTAYDAYLRGRLALSGLSGGETTYRQALGQFDAALAVDPKFAAAHALRARTLIAIASQFAKATDIPALTADALKSAERAVALAPDMAVAQSILASARLYGALDVRGSAAPFERSRQLGQGDADVLARYGLYAARTDHIAPAMIALRRAALLDPLNPNVQTSLSTALYVARRYVDAMAPLRRALELSPAMNGAHAYLGDCLLMLGRLDEARSEYLADPLALVRLTGFAIVSRRLGDSGAAEAAYRTLVAELGDSALYQQAQILSQWGGTEEALTLLERAYTARDTGLVLMNTDPLLDGLRGAARFRRLRNRLGFV